MAVIERWKAVDSGMRCLRSRLSINVSPRAHADGFCNGAGVARWTLRRRCQRTGVLDRERVLQPDLLGSSEDARASSNRLFLVPSRCNRPLRLCDRLSSEARGDP